MRRPYRTAGKCGIDRGPPNADVNTLLEWNNGKDIRETFAKTVLDSELYTHQEWIQMPEPIRLHIAASLRQLTVREGLEALTEPGLRLQIDAATDGGSILPISQCTKE